MTRRNILIYTEEFLTPSMTFIARQIEELSEEFDISVLTRGRINHSLFPFEPVDVVPVSFLEAQSKRLRRITDRREWRLSQRSEIAFRKAIARRRPSVIHAHFGPSALSILPAAARLGIPLVTTFHGFDASSLLVNRSYRADLKTLFDYSDIVAVSEEMRRALLELGANPQRTHCLYIGVPTGTFASSNRKSISTKVAQGDVVRFLQVSNFVEKKGHVFTLRAFAHVAERIINSELILVGSGPLMQESIDLCSELKLTSRVRFLGHKDTLAVAELMREADCFLHHSVTSSLGDKEGIPTVLMEAMASGLPVISTRHAGIPELIESGNSGILVDERDIPGYINALNRVLLDDGELGRCARVTVEEAFDLRKCTMKLASLYGKVVLPSKNANRSSGADRQCC